jgi:hypothetical protein
MSDRFFDMVPRVFGFLLDAGFRPAHGDFHTLRYETADVFVSIEWDARSGELELYVGLQPKAGESRNAFALSDLLEMEKGGVGVRNTPFQVAEESRLMPFLEQLATDARTYASSALAGDRMYFRRLGTYTDSRARTLMLDLDLRRVRAEAEKAWRERDLERVRRLYASIEEHLSGSEKKKLEYAKQHAAH